MTDEHGMKRIAIALEIDQPYENHQGAYSGVQAYARDKPDWRCVIDEHPGYKPASRGGHYQAYDGVIARVTPEMHRRLKRMGVPVVNTHFQAMKPSLYGVYTDPWASGRVLAEHLIERGFSRLCAQVDEAHHHSREIENSFIQTAEESGIVCTRHYYPEASNLDADHWVGMEAFVRDWIAELEPPVGIFIEVSQTARLFIQSCRNAGLHVPQEVAVVCRESVPALVEVSPQLSSLDMNNQLMGYEAARMLDRLMSGQEPAERELFVPPRGVVARESTDYFAVEDALVGEALRYISAHLREPLRVEMIAHELAVSTRSLQQHFSEALGRGVSEEIRRLRIESAKRMLAEPGLQIARIAELNGFRQSDIMNQVFRRELGMTPSAYRKKVLGDRDKKGAAG